MNRVRVDEDFGMLVVEDDGEDGVLALRGSIRGIQAWSSWSYACIAITAATCCTAINIQQLTPETRQACSYHEPPKRLGSMS